MFGNNNFNGSIVDMWLAENQKNISTGCHNISNDFFRKQVLCLLFFITMDL